MIMLLLILLITIFSVIGFSSAACVVGGSQLNRDMVTWRSGFDDD